MRIEKQKEIDQVWLLNRNVEGGSFFYTFSRFGTLTQPFLFDKNRIITQIQLQRALNEKETELQYYKDKIEEVGEEREALFTDKEALEKYARERYKFKKSNEDVFIIEKEE